MSLRPPSPNSVLGNFTEADIAQYLRSTPAFFERHADVLDAIQLVSPHGERAISLQERQLERERERFRGLKAQMQAMIEAGHANDAIARKLHRWVCAVMLARNAMLLGQVLIEELKHQFDIPQAAVRIWGAAPAHAHLPWARPVSDDVRTFAASLPQPYCGLNDSFEAATWLPQPGAVHSLAMVPLRLGRGVGECFGLLVLGSPDALRYHRDMATDFLTQVGELSSAALGRLLSLGDDKPSVPGESP